MRGSFVEAGTDARFLSWLWPFPGCVRTGCGAATGSNHAVEVPDIHPDTRDSVESARTGGHATDRLQITVLWTPSKDGLRQGPGDVTGVRRLRTRPLGFDRGTTIEFADQHSDCRKLTNDRSVSRSFVFRTLPDSHREVRPTFRL